MMKRVISSPIILLSGLAIILAAIWWTQISHSYLGVAGAYGFTVCHQIHSHSFVLGAWQFPLCARCSGLFLGSAVGLAVFSRKGRTSGLPTRRVLILLTVFFLLWAGDGLNAFMHDLMGTSLYPPSNTLRFITGSAMGMTLSLALLAVLNLTLWKENKTQALIRNGIRLILPLTLTLGLGSLLFLNSRIVFILLAYISIAAVILVITLLHTNIWVLLMRKENTFENWRELLPMLLLGFCTAQVQFMLLAAARLSLTGGWIVH